jgi:hypothetical protein
MCQKKAATKNAQKRNGVVVERTAPAKNTFLHRSYYVLSWSMDEGESGRRRIGDRAKERFLIALRRGVRLEEAARQGGFTLSGFYGARRRDAAFAEGWREALADSAARERFTANNRRPVQRRRMRHVRFDEERQAAFLDHLRGTCDTQAAADAAGVDKSTVYKHLRKDAGFAEEFQAALETGYIELEAAALRQRIEAQEKLRAGGLAEGEAALEFEQALKLLDRHDRRNGRVGLRQVSHGKLKAWSFDEAIVALDRKLRAFGLRRAADATEKKE